jgi:putative ABC transport system ATP-binding protein
MSSTDGILATLTGVDKQYHRGGEDIQILRELDLEIPRGEFLALMGPSGSGKTTLLNLLGGLDRPDAGSVEIDGRRIDSLDDRALARWRSRHVGFVFQMYNLLPVLTAARNVELPLLLTDLSKDERKKRVGIALEVVGLGPRKDHRPQQLSGGEQQRVGIARAIVTDPTLILADEPTGDLDRESADQVLGLLQRLNQEMGKTILMVTHDPRAADHARHVVHLDKGRLGRIEDNRQSTAATAGGGEA